MSLYFVCARAYNERNPCYTLHYTTVRDLLPKFIETGSVTNKKLERRNRWMDDVLENITAMGIRDRGTYLMAKHCETSQGPNWTIALYEEEEERRLP